MGRPMCVVRAHSCLPARVEPQLLMPQTALRFFFSVALPDRLHRNRQGIVRFCGLWLWQYLSVQRLLSWTCWLLSFLHCDSWIFVTFFKTSTRHYRFHHVGNSTVFAHRLSFEPKVVIQSLVSFDTEVERTRPSHVSWSSLAAWREQPDTFLLQQRT